MFIDRQAGINAVAGGNKGFGGGLLDFLKQPETLALAQGILAGSQPSMTHPSTFGGALGQGFAAMQTRGDKEREKERELERLAILKGHLGVDQSKLGLDRQKFASELAAKAAEAQALRDLFEGAASGAPQASSDIGGDYQSPQPSYGQASGAPEVTYTVQDYEINNGKPTQIPSSLNGRMLDEKEAKEIYKALQIQRQLTGGDQQPGILNQEPQGAMPPSAPQAAPQIAPPAPAAPSAPGNPQDDEMVTLGNGMKVSKEQLRKAKAYAALGYKDKAIATLFEGQSEQNLTGLPQEYASLEALRKRFGENSEVYQQAKRSLDVRLASQEQMTENRKKYLETADKRASTNLGKLELEKQEIDAGYLPGSNGTVELTPEQQQILRSRYDLMEQKISSDQDTRKRALFAANIDKTIENIDIDALTQYAGLKGATAKALENGKAMAGYTSEGYKKFKESEAAAKLLAKQVRQFYGESITPAATEAIDAMVNPATWKNNPELAKAAYEKVIDILAQETETIRGGLTGTESFKKGSGKKSGSVPVYRNGKKYMVPAADLEAALANGGTLE